MKNKFPSLLEIKLFLDPEDGGSRLFRNVHKGLQIYMASLVSFPMRCVCVSISSTEPVACCKHYVTGPLSSSIYFNFLEV